VWLAWRERAQLIHSASAPHVRALALAWLVPFAVFAILSPVRTIGLHWLLSFVPALILTGALALDRARLATAVRFFAWFGALHVVALGVAIALPLDVWKATPFYSRITFPGRTQELLDKIQPQFPAHVLSADSYASAALFAYYARKPVPVFGMGTSHARQDDITTDWRAYAGKDFVILRRQPPAAGEYRSFFREVEVRKVALGGGTYHAVIGSEFRYETYRSEVLAAVKDRFYRIPRWLPVRRCYFFERYFAQ
jgi:hypothetical protein